MCDITSFRGLVFVKNKPQGLVFCNLGGEIVSRMQDFVANSNTLPFLVVEILSDLISEFTYIDEEGNKYLALENIFILFEPLLKINVDMFIEQALKGVCLLIQSDHKADNSFYYPFPGNNDYKINLVDISYRHIGYEPDNQ